VQLVISATVLKAIETPGVTIGPPGVLAVFAVGITAETHEAVLCIVFAVMFVKIPDAGVRVVTLQCTTNITVCSGHHQHCHA